MNRILTTFVIFALALPAVASARRPATLAPPGNSAISQYMEVVPNDMGVSPPRSSGQQGGGLASGQRRGLGQLGADGRALVAVVDATSPQLAAATSSAGTRGERGHPGRGVHAGSSIGTGVAGWPAGAPPDTLSGSGAPSPAALMLKAASGGGGGVGVLLPALMLAGAVAVTLHAVRRRRAQGP